MLSDTASPVAPAVLPAWAGEVLACPHCHSALGHDGCVCLCPRCGEVGRWEGGIARFAVEADDPSIAWYQSVGGAHFQERMQIPFTMSALDTPVYHSFLEQVRPGRLDAVIVDLGAGDGRNTLPWLTWGYRQVIAVDAVAASLLRLRAYLCAQYPEWLGRVLLVQADVRRLPLATGSAACAVAIETLNYLNEDYRSGLDESRRILDPQGVLLTAERAWEGALLIHLLYGGVGAFCQLAAGRDVWDGEPGHLVRSRSFTEPELRAALEAAHFAVLQSAGVPVFSVVLGYLRGQGKISGSDEVHRAAVDDCLRALAHHGTLRKAHVMVAQPTGGERP
jgi:ubiquinone/menaquinone biosynthesis C-methylase UbiE